jgi:hypothetical protein
MADGLWRMPAKAEVAARDGKVGGYSQFFPGARAEQGAVVADAKAQAALRGLPGAAADLGKQGSFALTPGTNLTLSLRRPHFLRIGQPGGRVPASANYASNPVQIAYHFPQCRFPVQFTSR